MQYFALLSCFCASVATAFPSHLSTRGNCATGYTLCAPAGASSKTTPKIGDPTLQNLFVDLVNSSLPNGNKAGTVTARQTQEVSSLCCLSDLTCLAMSGLAIPFCYDRFTTNFFLADASYGTVSSGAYTTSTGDNINLISGDYVLKNGSTGNLYANNAVAKPQTAGLNLPAQFTGTGVGTAVPASALGTLVTITITTTLPGTTITATTIPATTRSAQVVGGSLRPETTITATVSGSRVTTIVPATSVPLSTMSATTIPESIITGTTILPTVATITTVVPEGAGSVSGSSTSATAAASSTKSSGSSSIFDLQGFWLHLVAVSMFALALVL